MTTANALPASDLRIDQFLVQPGLLRMTSGDATLRVEPKSMAVLMALATRPGQVVTRQELFDAVWPQESVSDDVLTRAIAELRKRFGDSAGEPRVIETIRGRGYRLIAEVQAVDERRAPTEVATSATGEAPGADQAAPRLAGSRRRSRAWLVVGVLGLVAAVVVAVMVVVNSSKHPVDASATALQIQPLTGSSEQDRDPEVSPDGTAVVFSMTTSELGVAHLYLKLLGAAQPLQLTSGPYLDRLPTFSPDGTRLSFVRRQEKQCGIFQVAATGGPVRRLCDCPPGGYLRMAWSPDGRWLVRSEAIDERTVGLALLDTESLQSQTLTRPPVDSVDNEPTFSPDGQWVGFNRSDFGGVSDLYAIRLSDREERRLTRDFRDVSGQSWTHDNQRILFSSDRAGVHSLWQVGLEGGEPVQWLTGGGSKIKHPSHARHAEVIAYEEWRYEINLWRFDLKAGPSSQAEPIVRSTAWDIHPAFSPDGEHLSFTSTRTGSHELWLARADGSEPMRLTTLDSGYVGQAAWSPDSRSLVFPAHSGGQTDLYSFEIGNVAPTRMTDDAFQELAPNWSADGARVYFSADRGRGFEIWSLPAGASSSSSAFELAQGTAAVESPDGSWLYVARLGDERVWRFGVLDAAGLGAEGERTNIKIGTGRRHSFQKDASGALFLERLPRQSLLKRLGQGGDAVTVASVPRFGRPEFTVSPDGRFLVFAQTDQADSDILVAQRLRTGP